MARQPRKVSQTGIYHVMLRGVNKQRIFENPSDYEAMYRILKFVQTTNTLQQPSSEAEYFLYAYCIMDNHIHLLIQPNANDLGQIVKRISTAYALYFNKKYERIGHLFQDRYKSEVVEDEDYFFTLLNYIHYNPVKAGYCQSPAQYAYSSWHEYLPTTSVKTTKEGLSLIGSFCTMPETMHLGITRDDIVKFLQENNHPTKHTNLVDNLKVLTQESNSDICKYIREKLNWLTLKERDQQIIETLYELTNTHSISEFQQLDKKTLRIALALVRDSGVPANRIAHLTGIPIGVIRYAKVTL
ncbi:MAG: transposase [Paludibacteraceae bacterium]|nr:transposase [Paludibacteraceae bacterium]